MSRNGETIRFCCVQFEGTIDDKQQIGSKSFEQNIHSVPELSMGTNSKIKFNNASKKNLQPIYQLLMELYTKHDKSKTNQILNILSKKRINPDFNQIGQRDDLQYYIPQLITYLVIQQNLEDLNLIQIILDACTTDFYFAHSVYFYLNSFTYNWMNDPIQNVIDFLKDQFLPNMHIYRKNRLSGIQFTKGMIAHEKRMSKYAVSDKSSDEELPYIQISYGTKKYPNPAPELPETIKKVCKKTYSQNGFMQTPSFWSDLITIGQDISSVLSDDRNDLLDHLIKTRVNGKLPASVYIPFFKDKIRMYTVLCVWKGRLFSTKERAPFSIWVQLYRQQEELQLIEEAVAAQISEMKCPKKQKKQKILNKIYQTLSRPFSITQSKNTLNIANFFKEKFGNRTSDEQKLLKNKKRNAKAKYSSTFYEPKSGYDSSSDGRMSLSFIYGARSEQDKGSVGSVESDKDKQKQKMQQNAYQKQALEGYFPVKSKIQIQQFRKRSIYRNLKSWRIAHLMVKTGDDLKQEQFAMQLINNFAGIFKKQNIDCALFPYEVISLGPNYGILQMLQDVTTFDALFKNLSQDNLTLKQFFNSYFPDRSQAKKNFMKSLAGYCLVTYFLQVKDRHNGNILLNRDGFIIHIDFGFFLSNMPGKGVELEKNVPFKLLSEYVQVLGSINSESFFQFRRLFYKGFVAITKHRQSIISLVKMMYSSHGQSMGCFIKNQQAVIALEKRLNPPEKIQQFCYDLINSSLDNWRSKWYDKFQYFLQKIYY